MYIGHVHLLVRADISSLQDLAGKKVSFHTPGAGRVRTAPILFQRLGIKVEPVYVNNAIALEQMKTGELAGLVNTGGKPQDLFTKFKNDYGYKFLSVPFDKFDDLYVPSVFTSEDYPGYIKPGEKVEALGVPVVLAVYNWPKENDRFRRIQRFIEYFFDRFEGFQKPPYHPAWKSINLAVQGAGVDALLGGRGEAEAGDRCQAQARPRRARRSCSWRASRPRARRPTMRQSRNGCSSSSSNGQERNASSELQRQRCVKARRRRRSCRTSGQLGRTACQGRRRRDSACARRIGSALWHRGTRRWSACWACTARFAQRSPEQPRITVAPTIAADAGVASLCCRSRSARPKRCPTTASCACGACRRASR